MTTPHKTIIGTLVKKNIGTIKKNRQVGIQKIVVVTVSHKDDCLVIQNYLNWLLVPT